MAETPAATPGQRRLQAEHRAQLARDNLHATIAALQVRLNPRTLASKAKRELSDAGQVAARVGAETAQRNPATLAGVTALAGLFLARHRIAALFRRKKKWTVPAAPISHDDH